MQWISMKRFPQKLVCLILMSAFLGETLGTSTQTAYAMDRDVKTLIKAGGYGAIGGALVGLATLPLTRDIRSIFMGSSIGLYLGIAAGVLYIQNRNESLHAPTQSSNLSKGESNSIPQSSLTGIYPRVFTELSQSQNLLSYYIQSSQQVHSMTFTVLSF
jgi:hypothetical protein